MSDEDEKPEGEEIPTPNALQKMDLYEREERRLNVMRLRLRGLTIRNIAKILNVTPKTIQRDLEAIREENASTVSTFHKQQFIGEVHSYYREIEEKAWQEFHSSKKTMERTKLLDLIRTLQNDKIKSMKDVGLIQPTPQKIDVTHDHHHAIQAAWTEEVQQIAAKALLEQALVTDLEEPVHESEILDAEYEEIRTDEEIEAEIREAIEDQNKEDTGDVEERE